MWGLSSRGGEGKPWAQRDLEKEAPGPFVKLVARRNALRKGERRVEQALLWNLLLFQDPELPEGEAPFLGPGLAPP